MMIYILLPVAAAALGIPLCRNKSGRIIYCVLMGLALFAVAAFRRGVGHDFNIYGNLYIDQMTMTLEDIEASRIEKGYAMISKLLADYIPDYQTIFVICAAFFAAAVSLTVYKYCELPWIGFACFLTFGVYFNSLNFLRQMIAGFIIMYAMRYIEDSRFLRFALIVIFASCFHLSALIMLPFFFILRIRMTPVTLGVYSALTAVFLVFSWDILDFITDYVYKGYDPRSNIHVTTGVDPIYMIFFAGFFAAAFVLRKELTEKDSSGTIFLNCMFFTLFFELLGVKHSILSRFGVFFIIPAAIVLMPRVVLILLGKCRKKGDCGKKERFVPIAALSVFAAANIAMYGLMIARNYNGVMPYLTIYDAPETEVMRQ